MSSRSVETASEVLRNPLQMHPAANTRTAWRTAAGFGYGLWLELLSWMLMGFGHGTYIPATVSSAPFGRIPMLAFFAAPFLWAYAFKSACSGRRKAFPALMAVHTLGVIVCILWPIDYEYRHFWRTVEFAPTLVLFWFFSYIGAHGLAWSWYFD